MTINDSRPKTKRRWLQFSLRTLLVFVTLSAFASGWFAVKMQRVRRQREAVSAIRAASGLVWYDYEVNARPTGSVPKPPGPAWMRKLLGDDCFAKVAWADVRDDAGLEHVKRLT